MRLNINKLYAIYTTSNYVENKQVKVLGFIGYDRASQYKSLVENIAINEKFINTTGDTLEYLKSQVYYDCEEIENINGEYVTNGNHYIFWDDIIDFERTQKINEKFTYKLEIEFKNLTSTDKISKDEIITNIKNSIKSIYNTTLEKVGIDITEIFDNSLDSITSQFTQTTELLEKSKETLQSFVSLENSANTIVENFENNNINAKINNISTQIATINSNINNIISKLK